MSKRKTTTANPQAVNTAVTNPGAIFNNIKLPEAEGKKGPKLETCEVGMFRLPGVKLDVEQFTELELKEMEEFARSSGAFIASGLYSWKSASKRDWFILKYS